jgi:tight adherence protein C
MVVLTIILVLLLVGLLSLLLPAGKKYQPFITQYKGDFQLVFLAPAWLLLLEKFSIIEKYGLKINQKIIGIYGAKLGLAYTRMYLSQLISTSYTILFFFVLIGLISGGDYAVAIFGAIISILIPPVMIKNLDKKIKRRKDQIIYDLPEFLNKVTLLVNAGETVQRAMIRCVEQKKNSKNALYVELRVLVNELYNNKSLSLVLEDFSKRCSVKEVSMFTTTVLLNYRKGGSEFATALQGLSRDLWEKRKSISRTLGEEASSKLVIPMVVIFLIIMIIVATPALLLI